MRTKKVGYGVIAAALLVLGWASVAFACSVLPQVSYSLLPESATPGSTVVVEGQNVRTQAQVEIRWNGVGGKVLALATPVNGAFSVPVQVPEATPGIYSLMLVTDNAGVGRTAFEVVGSATTAPKPQPAPHPWPGPSDAPIRADRAAGDPTMAGIGFLAIGLVGLFVGSTVAIVRRRRETVEVQQ